MPRTSRNELQAAEGAMKAAEMLRSKHSGADGRWDMAYVYANEAYLLLLEANNGRAGEPRSGAHPSKASSKAYVAALVRAEEAIREALHVVVPWKKRIEQIEQRLKEAREHLDKGRYLKVMRLSTEAYDLQPVGAKKPAALILRAKAYNHLRSYSESYVDASEALSLSCGDTSHILGLQREARAQLGGYENSPDDEQDMFDELGALCTLLKGTVSAPRYKSSSWPRYVKYTSLEVTWAPINGQKPFCMLEKLDGSYVQPAVHFNDLPVFFANHTDPAKAPQLANILLSFNDGLTPTEGQLRVLLEAAGCQGKAAMSPSCDGQGSSSAVSKMPNPFAALQFARVKEGDFHAVSASTFELLFSSVLAARSYQLMDFRKLPAGLQPSQFLLHPSLVASRSLEFSLHLLFEPLYMVSLAELRKAASKVLKFPSAAIISHLKRKGACTAEGETPPFLSLTEDYLAGSVNDLVKAMRTDFMARGAVSPQPPSGEKAKPNKAQSQCGKISPCSKKGMRFKLVIGLHYPPKFDQNHCGFWGNPLGEELRIYLLGTHFGGIQANMCLTMPNCHQIAIEWCGSKE